MSLLRFLFDLFASAYAKVRLVPLWEQSRINHINKDGTVISCPYCGSHESFQMAHWPIDSQFGLFDDDRERLRMIYCKNFPDLVPERVVSRLRQVALTSISGRSRVSYRRCKTCDLVFQNYPHNRSRVDYYYRNFYRAPWEWRHADTGSVVYGRDDEVWVSRQRLIGNYFLERTGLAAGSTILDVGCAEGHLCKFLESLSISAHGIDLSEPMINYARLILKLKHAICGDYDTTSYPAHTFDGIITHRVAEHVVGIKGFLGGLALHLKPGGYLLMQVPCVDAIATQEDSVRVLSGGHIYGFSEHFVRSTLASYGFDIVECKKTPCDLAKLDPGEQTPWRVSAWGDRRCGISVLAVKSR